MIDSKVGEQESHLSMFNYVVNMYFVFQDEHSCHQLPCIYSQEYKIKKECIKILQFSSEN